MGEKFLATYSNKCLQLYGILYLGLWFSNLFSKHKKILLFKGNLIQNPFLQAPGQPPRQPQETLGIQSVICGLWPWCSEGRPHRQEISHHLVASECSFWAHPDLPHPRLHFYSTPMESVHGSSVHRTLQARVLDWDAMPSTWGSSPPRDQTGISYVSYISRWVLYQ